VYVLDQKNRSAPVKTTKTVHAPQKSERISVFDIFKIGIGPSSSHTMGPWKAVQNSLRSFLDHHTIGEIREISVELYGSLAKTGKGHATDIAVMLALRGDDYATVDTAQVSSYIDEIRHSKKILLQGAKIIDFDPDTHIIFNQKRRRSFHANALTIHYLTHSKKRHQDTWYSIGGGFVVRGPENHHSSVQLPYPVDSADDLLRWCRSAGKPVSAIVFENEKSWRHPLEIRTGLLNIWEVMKQSVYTGCHSEGILPGGLDVHRRASYQNKAMIPAGTYRTPDEWIQIIRDEPHTFIETLNWVSCFALAVNEENAAFGRVVTAPTNGAAGVIPAVLLYYLCFCGLTEDPDPVRFLLVAGEIGSLFKKGATISAAMGGCQAEIGVSSAMAAGALTECLGGSPEEALMAAEIAMEHHLGLTCDPVRGLVQIPCIERNAMGAMKAITAAHIALASDPYYARVSLDDVIRTMWQTAQDMHAKYKETSEGGLAVALPVSHPEC
jgi:L-serine dehydratase